MTDPLYVVPVDTAFRSPPPDEAPEQWALGLVQQMLSAPGVTLFVPAPNSGKQDWSRNGPFQPMRVAVRAGAPGYNLSLAGRTINNQRGTLMWLEVASETPPF